LKLAIITFHTRGRSLRALPLSPGPSQHSLHNTERPHKALALGSLVAQGVTRPFNRAIFIKGGLVLLLFLGLPAT
jgi:hypothetical protein